MSNVINGLFGERKEDVEILGQIYNLSGVNCSGYSPDGNFSKLSKFSLSQEKAIRMIYEKMQDQVVKLANNFYENGQQERDLKIYTDFRNNFQEFEKLVLDTMR